MSEHEVNIINSLLIDQIDKIIILSTREIPVSLHPEESIEHLCHKLIKNSVKGIAIKRKIVAKIRHNQIKDSYVI